MANNQYINKVIYGNTTLLDLTSDTATADKVLKGYTFHDKTGASVTGTAQGRSADIVVTYSSAFYNKTITCTKGSTTYTQTTTSSGSTTFSVSDAGEWTITCNGVTIKVDVIFDFPAQFVPNGKTVTPTDNIQKWLNCAGIFDKTSYTTLANVLADSTTLLALMSNNNAVDYLVRSTTWASGVCANSTAMTDIGANNYCANTLLADSTWCNAICNSTYFESVLTIKVPTMTSSTTPSGKCFGSAPLSNDVHNFGAYNAFGGSSGYGFSSDKQIVFLGYEFPTACVVKKVYVKNITNNSGVQPTQLTVKATNDTITINQYGTLTSSPTWTTLASVSVSELENTIVLPQNTTAYTAIMVEFTYSGVRIQVRPEQFYGR